MTETFDWLRETLSKDYKLAPDLLTPDASLETLGLDSLALTELLFEVEDRYGITFPKESVELPTLGDVVRFIDDHIAAQCGDSGTAPPSSPTA